MDCSTSELLNRYEFEKQCVAGGHSNHFQIVAEFGDSVLLKKTNNHEITSYERIFHSCEDDPHHEENLVF